jgi:hypothetical protein
MKNLKTMAALASLLLLTCSTFARAWILLEPGNHLNQAEVELHTIFGWGEPGAGFRVGIPILNQGLLPGVNNSVAVSFGADVLRWPQPDFGGLGVAVPVMLQWNFFLAQNWTVFGEGGAAFQNWPDNRVTGDLHTFSVWPSVSTGIRYYINPGNYPALAMRVGYPSLMSLGVVF